MKKRITILLLIAIIGAFFIGHSIANNEHYKSRKFLNKYDYHIDKSLETNTVRLQNVPPHGVDLILRASNKINMPLDKYINQDLRAETYRLKEKSQFDLVAEIDATILFNSNNEIAGAYLNVKGYLTSILALNERYFLEPKPKINPEKLNLTNINEIKITGPGNNEKVLEDKRDIDNFLEIINNSSPKNEALKYKDISSASEYRVWFKYDNGANIKATIYIHKDFNKIDFGHLYNWNYEASQELVDFINSVLK